MAAQQGFALGTFSTAGGPKFPGLVAGEEVFALAEIDRPLRREGLQLQGAASTLALLDNWDHDFPLIRAAAEQGLSGGTPLASLEVHAPVEPRQIFCAGANYHKHVVDLVVDGAMARDANADRDAVRARAEAMMSERAKSGMPFVFMGAPSAIIGPFDDFEVPYDVRQPDWELELAAVIGRSARRVSAATALEHVAGYTIANDITARELVNRPDVPQMGMDWLAAKCSPGFLPLGPFVTPAAFVGDPQALRITLKLNGQTMQDESTADMIFGVARIIEFLSSHVRLLPGDLVLTGSPSGNGTHYGRFIQDGDVLEGSIAGLGTQRNRCVAEPAG
jgi:2-keto-4-pentenoate hydratase/2-oxohepta-3-ene-1,7-dioic acid hydratase in catechol pathway